MEPLPSNSLKSKEVEPVVTTPGQLRKKPFTKRLAGALFSSDGKTMKEKILMDILVPVVKDTVVTVIVSTAETLFYGSPNGRIKGAVNTLTTGHSYTNYSDPLKNRANYTNNNGVVRIKTVRGVDDILVQTQGEAHDILRYLNYDIDQYGHATVAKAYMLAKLKAEYMDEDYGWYDLSAARITKAIGQTGYLLELPSPSYLKKK